MNFVRGQLVRTLKGRDVGIYVVTGEKDGYVLIANGRQYRLDGPKRKNPKHLAPSAGTLGEESLAFDKQLKRALAAYAQGAQ